MRAVEVLATLCLAAVLLGSGAAPSAAEQETTVIHTFSREFVNWAEPHVSTFQFPPPQLYSEVICNVTIACPGSPGDCDPWDRFANIKIRHYEPDSSYTDYEIVRFITPYDITYPGGPYACPWQIDVTDYQFMLHDEVTLVLFIDSWIGGDQGWLITADFQMTSGDPEREPFAIERLWRFGTINYGDPDNPIEDHLAPMEVEIPAEATEVKFRAFSTGHGFYNTDNAAEFSYKWQGIHVNEAYEEHYLWRADCEHNPCSPQQGTWEYDRAGWCPGDKAEAWDVEVTDWVTPGQTSTFDFDVQPYENWCRPNNPDCVDTPTCECPGHAYYRIECQAVFYREPVSGAADESHHPSPRLLMADHHPNPFHPRTTIRYRLTEPADVSIAVYDVKGARVRSLQRQHPSGGSFTWSWDGRDQQQQALPAGIYLYEVCCGAERVTAKMMMVK